MDKNLQNFDLKLNSGWYQDLLLCMQSNKECFWCYLNVCKPVSHEQIAFMVGLHLHKPVYEFYMQINKMGQI